MKSLRGGNLMDNERTPRRISVIVPAYNSAAVLPLLVSELGTVLPKCSSGFELILLNDASPDRSWEVIAELTTLHPWVHGINLMRNVGQHNALLCGIRAAKYEIIVTIDDDLHRLDAELEALALEPEDEEDDEDDGSEADDAD